MSNFNRRFIAQGSLIARNTCVYRTLAGVLACKMSYRSKFGGKPEEELNISNLAKVLEAYHVKYPKIVIAQALLETGYFTSRACWECKNLFGLRRPSDGSYYKFDHWEESVKAYRDYVQYKYKGGNYLQFLDRIGYAEDKTYTMKVLQIAKRL